MMIPTCRGAGMKDEAACTWLGSTPMAAPYAEATRSGSREVAQT
jgi:hypothetical protein